MARYVVIKASGLRERELLRKKVGHVGGREELGVREIKTHSDAGVEVTEVLAI